MRNLTIGACFVLLCATLSFGLGRLFDDFEQVTLDNNARIEVMLKTCFPNGRFDDSLDGCVAFRKYLEGELNDNQ